MKSNCPYWWGKGHRWQNPHWFLPDLCLELVVLGRTAEGRSEQELLAHCYSLWARPLASLSVRSYPRCLCQKGALCLCSQAGLRAHSLTQLIWWSDCVLWAASHTLWRAERAHSPALWDNVPGFAAVPVNSLGPHGRLICLLLSYCPNWAFTRLFQTCIS